MRSDVRKAVGRPDNSAFVLRCVIYGVILAAMLFAAPSVFAKIMVPMAAKGVTGAWYAVFVPVVAAMMAISLFRTWRRRWPLAFMNSFKRQAEACDYSTCPRCGAPMVLKRRTRYHREKVGEEITTTTYTDGSKDVSKKDIYGSVKHAEYYHECTNGKCKLEAEQQISQSHLPWKIKEIRCLVLNEDKLLGRKHPSARSILLSRLLAPILALVIVLVCAGMIYNYESWQHGEWNYVTADREADRSAEEYQNYLQSLDEGHLNWHMSYEKEKSDMMSYLGDWVLRKDKSTGYSMESYTFEGGTALCYRFEGDDAGTGLPDGRYMLTQVDGVNVLLDEDKERIYKQDTEFYTTYAPALQALSHDAALGVALERVSGGEHALSGSNNFWMEYVRKDDTMLLSYMNSNDHTKINGEFRVVTADVAELQTERWIFSYDDYEYNPVDLKGFVYSDAAPEAVDDELSKLIKGSSEGRGDYTLYRNEEEVLDVDIDNLVNGYEYCIDGVKEGFELAFEEDVTYRINTTAKTLTKISTDENYRQVESDMPLSEYQAEYDFLLSIAPEAYIRRIIDMDKAEVKNENAGLVKNYIMKDENGIVTAEMKVAFGKIGEVIHHIGENEYAKIELAY